MRSPLRQTLVGVAVFGLAAICAACIPQPSKPPPPPPPPAPPTTTVSCGMNVTTDILVGNDLICFGNGLNVGADGIVIDLNGHTISGVGGDAHVGVNGGGNFPDSQPARSFTVKNGAVAGFSTGISATEDGSNGYGVHQIVVDGVHVVARTGVRIAGPNGNTVSHSTFEARQGDDDAVGINAAFIGGNRADNYLGNTFRHLSVGVALHDETNVTVDSNSFSMVGTGVSSDKSDNVTISNNTFDSPGGALAGSSAVRAGDEEHLTIRNNSISSLQVGILLYGGLPGGGFGLFDVSVENNNIEGAGASGIAFLGGYQDDISISGNSIGESGFDPRGLTNAPMGNELLDDGIHIDSTHGVVNVGSNRANSNADRGIQATGVTDRGGNTAANNLGPVQCQGVLCS